MSEHLGTLVIDEIVFAITDIELVNRTIVFRGTRKGPCSVPGPGQAEFRVHGHDGSLVAVGPWKGPLGGMSALGPDDTMHVFLPIAFNEISGWAAPRVDTRQLLT